MKSFLAVLCACVIAVQAHPEQSNLMEMLNPQQRMPVDTHDTMLMDMFQQLMMGQDKHHDSSESEEDKLNKEQKAILDMHMFKKLYEGFKMYMDYKNAENEFTHMMAVLCTMMKVSEDYGMANNKTWQHTTEEEVEKMKKDSKDMTLEARYMFLMKEINSSEERFYEILMRVNMGVCHSAKAYHAMEEKVEEKMEGKDKK